MTHTTYKVVEEWTDDFPTDVPDELCIRAFIEQLEEEFL